VLEGEPLISRRRLLTGILLGVPAALTACSFGPSTPEPPDPLIALAAAARSDAALAAAAVAASPELTGSVQPLVDARTQHAAALDAEITRLDPDHVPPTSPAPRPAERATGLAEVREAVLASGRAATEAVLGLPAERAGLVASVAACCNAYGAVLS
jgi:hypothetical protein